MRSEMAPESIQSAPPSKDEQLVISVPSVSVVDLSGFSYRWRPPPKDRVAFLSAEVQQLVMSVLLMTAPQSFQKEMPPPPA